jgi:hypothetical protein
MQFFAARMFMLPRPVPYPYPQNEHEARIFGLLALIAWGIGLVFLYWAISRPLEDETEKQYSSRDQHNGD